MPHYTKDVLLYLPFLIGQFLYVLKRAGFSMRAGRAPTRRAYFWLNWDILIFRAALAILVYGFIRHFSPGQVLGFFHIDLTGFSSLAFLYTPIDNLFALFGMGLGADGAIDWGVDWASRKENTKVPQAIKTWLSENVPPANGAPK